MTTLNKCARAAADAFMEDYEEAQNLYDEVARAVLTALLEPDESVKVTGGLTLEQIMFGEVDDGSLIFDDVGRVFTTMIQHILNGGEGK